MPESEARLKPVPLGSCIECDALWRKFAHATAEHVKLLMESQLATVNKDVALSAKAEESIPAAEARRAAAREAVHAHERSAHGKATGTQA